MATRKTRTFTDINLLFTAHPATADVVQLVDEEAVKGAIRNLIQTKFFERPFHPEIGCGIHNLLFENFTPITVEIAKRMIFDVLNAYEPRAEILYIRVKDNSDQNELSITVEYKLVNSEKPVTVTTILNRAR